MKDFATKNNIAFTEYISNPDLKGVIFNDGENRHIEIYYSLTNNIDIGNYTYSKGDSMINYGYVKIPLIRNLPHIYLRSKSSNLIDQFTGSTISFNDDQKLVLEGDFNNYFTLFTPKDYKTDALYIFTPDVMQTLVLNANNYDIEIVDNELFIYKKSGFALANKEELKKLFDTANELEASINGQSSNYSDERVGNKALNIVAPTGGRLKSNNTAVTIFAIVFVSFVVIRMIFHDNLFIIIVFAIFAVVLTSIYLVNLIKNQ